MGAGGWDFDLIEYAHWARDIRGLADTTIRVRLDLLQRLCEFLGIPLRKVQPGHLLRFERIAIAGRAPETRRAYVCHVRAFYRWALATGRVTADPAEVLTIPVVPKHLPRPIEEDALAAALAAARPKMRAMLTLAAYAGLRCVEIARLDWTDLRRGPGGDAFLHIRGKGDKERIVEIGQTVTRALQAYGIRRRGPMFFGADGLQIDARSVSSSGNRFLARHGIDATMHQLRHRYGVQMYQASRDLRMVQDQMGHSSPTTTQIYTRPSAEAAAHAVAILDQLPGARMPDSSAGHAPPVHCR